MDLFTILFYQPIYNLLVFFYHLFGSNLGLAIIAIALITRVLMFPLTTRQVAMAEKSRELNEKVKALKAKHGEDKEALNQEMLKVQSEYLPGQLNGCLSLIVQLVVIINIYNVISNLFSPNGIATFNSLAYPFVPKFAEGAAINGNFFGIIDLQTVGNTLTNAGLAFVPYVVLAILAGAGQYYSNRILMGLAKRRRDGDKQDGVEEAEIVAPKKKHKAKSKKEERETTEKSPDFAEIMERSNRQTIVIFSVMLVFMSLSLPAGLSLYWTVQSGLVIIQQLLLDKFVYGRKSS
jgi:YidC/Oxa1 family membrane protein insertase